MRRVIMFALLLLVSLFPLVDGMAQSPVPSGRELKLISQIPLPNEPIKVICYNYGRGDNWLETLSFEVENVSGKFILDLEGIVLLDSIEGLEHPVWFSIMIDKRVDKFIPPGGKGKLIVSPDSYGKARQLIEKRSSISALDSAVFFIHHANFGNGNGWYKGSPYLQNINQLAGTPRPGVELSNCAKVNRTRKLDIVRSLRPFGGTISEPVRIVNQILPSENDDWLKYISIEVENTSDKPIKYIECIVLIRDINRSENCIAIPMVYSGNNNVLLPGERAKLKISESAYNGALELIEQVFPIDNIDKADLIVGQVYFTDGNGWFNSSLLQNVRLEPYRSGSAAFLISKDNYIWGRLRNRDKAYSDIYLGFKPRRDEDEEEEDEYEYVIDPITGRVRLRPRARPEKRQEKRR